MTATLEITVRETLTGEYGEETVEAAERYLRRRDRLEHPTGNFDRAGRFYVAEDEKCDCCIGIRSPSARFPYSQMLHARTAKHVAAVTGVEEKLVKRVARKLES